MWDLLGQIGYQVSRAGNAASNVFGGGVETNPDEYDIWGVRKENPSFVQGPHNSNQAPQVQNASNIAPVNITGMPGVNPGYNPANGGSISAPTPGQVQGMINDPTQQQKIGDKYFESHEGFERERLSKLDPVGGNIVTGGASAEGGATTEGGAAAAASGVPGWVGPAVIGAGAVAGVAGPLLAAKAQGDAEKEAAQTRKEGTDAATQLLKDQFNQIRDDQKPWREAGGRALTGLESFDANNPRFGMSQFQADPGYSFRLKEGMKALENSAAARGGLLSGNTMKGITNYGQEAASQEYQNAFNRYQTERNQRLNNLQSLAGIGQTSLQLTGQAGQNYANSAGQMMTGGANALAQGRIGAGNANASGYMGAANALTNALSGYLEVNKFNQRQNTLNSLLGGQ